MGVSFDTQQMFSDALGFFSSLRAVKQMEKHTKVQPSMLQLWPSLPTLLLVRFPFIQGAPGPCP